MLGKVTDIIIGQYRDPVHLANEVTRAICRSLVCKESPLVEAAIVGSNGHIFKSERELVLTIDGVSDFNFTLKEEEYLLAIVKLLQQK